MYSNMKWLVKNNSLDEMLEAQTKTVEEVLQEFVTNVNGKNIKVKMKYNIVENAQII